MKTYVHYGNISLNDKYLRQSCRENRNKYFMLNNFLRKSCRLRGNVEKYDSARLATDDNVIRRIRFAC
jgi:hypothetical protein